MTYVTRQFVPLSRAAAFALLLFAGMALPSSVQARGVYTAAKIAVDVTAKDAVAAKKTALAEAKQRALRTVFKRLAPYSAYDRLPAAKTAMIDDMLENFTVRREQNSATRYLATLDFEFNADSIRRFLEGHNVPSSDLQAPPVVVLPVFIQQGKVVSTGRDPWRRAWLELDLSHAVTPVKLVSHGASLNQETLAQILAGEGDGYAAMREKYKGDTLVLAIADTTDGSRLAIRLFGIDAAGSIALEYARRLYDGNLLQTAKGAAALSLRVLEGRWKVTQTIDSSDGEAAAQHSVLLTVEFASLRQWQDMKSRLAKIPGVQSLEVTSLSARSADVTFRFPGGVQGLAGKLRPRNLALSNIGGVFVLRSN